MKNLLVVVIFMVRCITAAETALPDWRELWEPERGDKWRSRPIDELRTMAATNNPYAVWSLFEKIWRSDRDEARRLKRAAFEAGLPQAIYEVAQENGTRMRDRLALFEKAADLGYPLAQYELGLLALHNEIQPDYEKALRLVRAAYDQKLIRAYHGLAMLYSIGVGEPRSDKETPIRLLKSVAPTGYVDGIRELERRLRLGIGVERDLLGAVGWFSCAQTLANYPQSELTREEDVRSEPNQELFRRLSILFEQALAGNRPSQIELAGYHANGVYGQTNLVRACALFTFAGQPCDFESKFTDDERKALKFELSWMQHTR